MLNYECWFASPGKRVKSSIESISPKHAAKEFIKRNWYKHSSKIENPWDNTYTVSVEDIGGYIVSFAISIEPTFYANSSVKFRNKK